ncbi:alpha/beta fold hydrolase [Streptomonospora salina]|uniref:Pimeloyl-ACP methyl ester carboxylesterase n=1 Tax=Streptomonospora salina TaxID=104205 RepID=A0A841E5P7_9ACTN|nr:alpha/beta hydrolase [Streptomonospora salina]MBB5997774.1 pimeloyl-ACP methyl ester carboxylesterase [Streptomonospora salina]
MTEPTTREPETRTLEAPGATIHYDVRGDPSEAAAEAPTLMLVGSPMGASGFTTLAGYFGDRPVVTYDPRSAGRSTRTDGAAETTPEEHAEDLRLVIEALGVDRVDLFGSSGGAVNSLALVAEHPERVRTLVAHEPPLAEVLPDREQIVAACEDISRTYRTSGFGPAMATFISLAQLDGPVPDGFAGTPVDPARYGLPTEDDGSRDDPLVGHNIRTCCSYRLDYDAVAAAPTRAVLAVGRESGGELSARGAVGVAQRLGIEPTMFPSHHAGYMAAEESGMEGDPEGFAAALRRVLSDA